MNEGQEHGGSDRWPSEDIAERLLRGEAVADADPHAAALARLLTAAAQPLPGRPEHERAALEAFLLATRTATGAVGAFEGPAPGVRRRWRPARASRPVKVLIAGAVAVFVLGGAAVAAQTGVLPRPFHSRPAPPGTGTPTAGSPSPTTVGPPSSPGARGAGGGPRASHAPVGASPHNPSDIRSAQGAPLGAGAKGLCEAYVKAAHTGQPVDTTSRARLAQAAGGADRIDAYCAQLTGPGSPAAPSPSAAVPSNLATRPSAHVTKSPNPHAFQSPGAPGAVRQK
jgi:hypothetical protein